jgi:cytochrome c oxidase subunit IV
MRALGPEVTLFARMATFGIVVGAVYWFLTYEVAGTVLLSAFGLASALAASAVYLGGRFAGRRSPADHAAAPLPAETEPAPRPGWAPLGIALGLGGVALGAAFGPWLAIAGALVAVRSAKSWLDTAVEETDEARGVSRDEESLRDA